MSYKRKYDSISQADNYSNGISMSTMPNFGFGTNEDFILTDTPTLNKRDRKIQYNIRNYGKMDVINNIKLGDALFLVPFADSYNENGNFVFNLALYRIFLFNIQKTVFDIKKTKQKSYFAKFNKSNELGFFYEDVLNQGSLNISYFSNEIEGSRNLIYNYKGAKNFFKTITQNIENNEKKVEKGEKGEIEVDVKNSKELIDKFGSWEEKEKWASANVHINDYTNIASLTQKVVFIGICNAPDGKIPVGGFESSTFKKKKTKISSNAIWNKGNTRCVLPVQNELFYTGLVVLKYKQETHSYSEGDFTYIVPYLECIEPKDYISYTWKDKETGSFGSAMPLKLGRISEVLHYNTYTEPNSFIESSKYGDKDAFQDKNILSEYKDFASVNNCILDVNYCKMVSM
jgi:hypothetical protein